MGTRRKNAEREGKGVKAITQPQWRQKGAGRSRRKGTKTRGGLVRDGFQNAAERAQHSDPVRMMASTGESCHEISSTRKGSLIVLQNNWHVPTRSQREVCRQMTDRGKEDSREARKQDKGRGEKAEAGLGVFCFSFSVFN